MAIEKLYHISVMSLPRSFVWARLLDPAVLVRCLDGCEKVVLDTDNRYRYQGQYKFGPISRQFKGTITVTTIAPGALLHFYRGSYQRYLGAGAFSGRVRLDDHPEGTQIMIEVEVEMSTAIRTLINLFRPRNQASPLDVFVDRFASVASETPASA
jgi:uncharacterized protein